MLTRGPHTGYYYTPPAEVTSQGYFRLYSGVVAPEEPLCGLYKNKTYNTGGKMPLLASQPVHRYVLADAYGLLATIARDKSETLDIMLCKVHSGG